MERRTIQSDFSDVYSRIPAWFYSRLDRNALPKDAKRDKISLYKLPSNRPDIVSLFESMTPYFDSNIQPTDELLHLKMIEGIYVLLNTSKHLYASVFGFADPWKIDHIGFSGKQLPE